MNGCSQQQPIVTPTHLRELRLKVVAATHIVEGGADTTANFTLEEDGRLLEEPDWHALAGQVRADPPNAEGVLAARGEEFIVGAESHALDAAFPLDCWQFAEGTLFVHVPNHGAAVLPACCKQQLFFERV